MLKLLTWNIGLREGSYKPNDLTARTETLKKLLQDHTPSIVFLQEADPNCNDLKTVFSNHGYSLVVWEELITAFITADWVKTGVEQGVGKRLLSQRLIRGSQEIVTYNLHLRSKLHSTEEDQDDEGRPIVAAIHNWRSSINYGRPSEIIGGDFNLHPYEAIMIQKSGFYGNRCVRWVEYQTPKASWPYRPLFNSTWEILGRRTEPQGSYYRSSNLHGPWLAFDQLLLTGDLAALVSENRVVTTAGGGSIAGARSGQPKKPDCSDHFPVFIGVKV